MCEREKKSAFVFEFIFRLLVIFLLYRRILHFAESCLKMRHPYFLSFLLTSVHIGNCPLTFFRLSLEKELRVSGSTVTLPLVCHWFTKAFAYDTQGTYPPQFHT